MRRARRRSRPLLVAVAAVALIAGACSGDDAVDATLPPSTTAATTTTTAAPTTTTSAPTTTAAATTTTTAAPTDTVGSPQALAELIATIQQELAGVYPDIVDAEIPIPDLTNPDPVVAAEELNKFGQWVNANYPANEWNQVRAHVGSPTEDLLELANETLYFSQQRWVRHGDPWVFYGGRRVDLEGVDLPTDLADAMPASVIGVAYESSSGVIDIVDASTGEKLDDFGGWSRRTSLELLVATSLGWRSWGTVTEFGASA